MSETRRFLKGGAIDDGTPSLQLQIWHVRIQPLLIQLSSPLKFHSRSRVMESALLSAAGSLPIAL